MELNEVLLFVAAIVVMITVSIYINRRLTPKGKIIANLLAVLLLSGMFIYLLIEKFTYTLLTFTSGFIFLNFYSFYRRYRKYKQGLPIDTD